MLPLGKYTCAAKNCMGTTKRSVIIFSNPNNVDDATISYQTAEQDNFGESNEKTLSDSISNNSGINDLQSFSLILIIKFLCLDELFLSYAIEDTAVSNYYAISFPAIVTNQNEKIDLEKENDNVFQSECKIIDDFDNKEQSSSEFESCDQSEDPYLSIENGSNCDRLISKLADSDVMIKDNDNEFYHNCIGNQSTIPDIKNLK